MKKRKEASRAVVIFTLDDGRVVLQRRTADAPTNPGKLGFFGGHMEPGEGHRLTISREIAEETSIDPKTLQLIFIGGLPEGRKHKTEVWVYCAQLRTAEFAVYEGDRQEVYTTTEALARDDLTSNTRRGIELYCHDSQL